MNNGKNDAEISELIQKLLALAVNNPNRHEAAVAYQKAQDLMRKHGLRVDVVRDASQAAPPPPPPRPQWTPPPPSPPPQSQPAQKPQHDQFVSWLVRIAFLYGLLMLGVFAYGLGRKDPQLAVGFAVFAYLFFVFLRIHNLSFSAIWKNHRRKLMATVFFLGVLCSIWDRRLPSQSSPVSPPNSTLSGANNTQEKAPEPQPVARANPDQTSTPTPQTAPVLQPYKKPPPPESVWSGLRPGWEYAFGNGQGWSKPESTDDSPEFLGDKTTTCFTALVTVPAATRPTTNGRSLP